MRTPTGRFQRTITELQALWSVACAEANIAYDEWRARPSRDAYIAYRAAEDRADAAQDALAANCVAA